MDTKKLIIYGAIILLVGFFIYKYVTKKKESQVKPESTNQKI